MLSEYDDPSHGWEPLMTMQTDHSSKFGPGQLALLGAAAIALLVFAWTFVHWRAARVRNCGAECPLWVKSRRLRCNRPCLLCRQKRTFHKRGPWN